MRTFAMVMSAGLLLGSTAVLALDLGKMPDMGAVNTSPLENVNKRLADRQIEDGQFEFKRGSADFAPGNEKRVKGLVNVLTENSKVLKAAFPKYYVTAEGHTDSDGNATANQKLSLARANKVCSELKKNGLAVACKAIGAGSSKPLVTPEKSDADKQRNRRVLVQVAK